MAGEECGRVAAKRVQYLLRWSFLTFTVCESGWQFECGEREAVAARKCKNSSCKWALQKPLVCLRTAAWLNSVCIMKLRIPFPLLMRPVKSVQDLRQRATKYPQGALIALIKLEWEAQTAFVSQNRNWDMGMTGFFSPAIFWRAPKEREGEKNQRRQQQRNIKCSWLHALEEHGLTTKQEQVQSHTFQVL